MSRSRPPHAQARTSTANTRRIRSAHRQPRPDDVAGASPVSASTDGAGGGDGTISARHAARRQHAVIQQQIHVGARDQHRQPSEKRGGGKRQVGRTVGPWSAQLHEHVARGLHLEPLAGHRRPESIPAHALQPVAVPRRHPYAGVQVEPLLVKAALAIAALLSRMMWGGRDIEAAGFSSQLSVPRRGLPPQAGRRRRQRALPGPSRAERTSSWPVARHRRPEGGDDAGGPARWRRCPR